MDGDGISSRGEEYGEARIRLLGWIDPETGERLSAWVEGTQGFFEGLYRAGFWLIRERPASGHDHRGRSHSGLIGGARGGPSGAAGDAA